jgi:hypothetical protein
MANRLIVATVLLTLAAGSRVWAQTPASDASKAGHPATPSPTAPGPVQSPSKIENPRIGGGSAPAPWAHEPPHPIKAPEARDLKPVKKDEDTANVVGARKHPEPELPLLRRVPIVTWVDPAPIKQGQALTGRELDAISDVPGTFVFTPSAGFMPPRGSCTITAQFLPSDSERYESTTATVVLTVE